MISKPVPHGASADIPCESPSEAASGPDRGNDRLRLAEGLVRMRQLRTEIFNPDYFGEAAFDMLLDLYICHRHGRTVYQNDAYIASLVPAATAHRWLMALRRDQMVALSDDRGDRRRSIVSITPAGAARVETLLDAWLDIRNAVVDGSAWA